MASCFELLEHPIAPPLDAAIRAATSRRFPLPLQPAHGLTQLPLGDPQFFLGDRQRLRQPAVLLTLTLPVTRCFSAGLGTI